MEMRSAVAAVAKALEALSNPPETSDFGKFNGELNARQLLIYLEEGFLSFADKRKALSEGQSDTFGLNRGRVHEYEKGKST